MTRKTLNQLCTKGLAYAMVGVVVFLFLSMINVFNIPVYQNITIKYILVIMIQLVFLFFIIKAPIGKSAKIKGVIGILAFLIVRLTTLLTSFYIGDLTYSLYWFGFLFFVYMVACVFAFEALKDVQYD